MKTRNLSLLLTGGVAVTVLLYTGILLFLTWPVNEISISKSGVFGDSFGPLTSLFSGLAFAGLIITIVMQRDELALQRQELNLTREELRGQKHEMRAQNETLRVQRFENTFFKMLEFLEACRNDVEYIAFKEPHKRGRDAIKAIYQNYTNGYLSRWVQEGIDGKRIFLQECKNEEGVAKKYNELYANYGDELGQYYRTLYNLLKLVEHSDFVAEKTVYTNLIRAQLSRYELSLLFYNCISDYGRDKMMPLVKKYNLLKHLEASTIPDENSEILRAFNS